MFDLAVNGGGWLTVNYTKTSYLPAQRKVEAPWQDYAWLPDVMLIQEDPNVTLIDLNANIPMQVARGSVISDTAGVRRATLLVPQGTQAYIFDTDGVTQTATTLHLRFTEYTVGEQGPESMPAELPPTSGYTYAVELGADEAIAKMGGRDVIFNQPVVFYLENFLALQDGVPVPMGYYDPEQGAWTPYESGRIVRIVSLTDGMADLDVDGDGVSDSGAALTALGITDAERSALATLYAAAQSLWRARLEHLSTWDANQGTRCKDNKCEYPSLPGDLKPQPLDQPGQVCRSIVGCQDQTLAEVIDLVGVPFRLHYQSARTPGRATEYQVEIPLSGPTLPANVLSILREVSIAGRQERRRFAALPNQSETFTWDGRDAYGRSVVGAQNLRVRVGYVYKLEYVRTTRFGYNGSGTIGVLPSRQEFILWQIWDIPLLIPENPSGQLGGWSLDIHHTYDPQSKTLYLGNGTRRGADSLNFQVIDTAAGVAGIQSVVAGADGSLLWALAAGYIGWTRKAPSRPMRGTVICAGGGRAVAATVDQLPRRACIRRPGWRWDRTAASTLPKDRPIAFVASDWMASL
jgi:hypothetical protein